MDYIKLLYCIKESCTVVMTGYSTYLPSLVAPSLNITLIPAYAAHYISVREFIKNTLRVLYRLLLIFVHVLECYIKPCTYIHVPTVCWYVGMLECTYAPSH